MFIEETYFDGDIFINGNTGCGCYHFTAAVQIRAKKNAGGPGV